MCWGSRSKHCRNCSNSVSAMFVCLPPHNGRARACSGHHVKRAGQAGTGQAGRWAQRGYRSTPAKAAQAGSPGQGRTVSSGRHARRWLLPTRVATLAPPSGRCRNESHAPEKATTLRCAALALRAWRHLQGRAGTPPSVAGAEDIPPEPLHTLASATYDYGRTPCPSQGAHNHLLRQLEHIC